MSQGPDARYVIWWTNQPEATFAFDNLPPNLPEYIVKELRSRMGRGARGRLWVPTGFGEVSVDPWPENLLAKWLGSDSGGIVIRAEHAPLLAELPGTFTDNKLNKLTITG